MYFFIGFLIVFLSATLLGKILIPILHKLKFGQMEREEGMKSHQKKSGTPTMGGFIFIIPILVMSIVSAFLYKENIFPLISMLMFALVGFIDDYIKVVKKRNLGLRAYQKIILQVLFAFLLSLLSYKVQKGGFLLLPFSNFKSINLEIMIIPFSMFIFIALSNSVNLTDGLDGLCASVTTAVALFFFIFSYFLKSGLNSFALFLSAGCLGFLTVNKYPAKVFMGDTGSMALGGAIAGMAVINGLSLYLPFIGFIYMIETLSVIIQVVSFKTTGKRVFLMSPLHHHFEMLGFKETSVVFMFTAVTVFFCTLMIVFK